jgi:hypothetical protein
MTLPIFVLEFKMEAGASVAYVHILPVFYVLHSDWVSDCCFNANSAIFQLYHGEKVNFQWDDDEVWFILDQHT